MNAHIHVPPNFSAFASVGEAVRLADEQNVRVLGVSNYYDYRVYEEFAEEARRRGVYPLFGMEIIAVVDELAKRGVRVNDPDNPGRMYLCGKGITRYKQMSKRAKELIGTIRGNDETRMREMTGKLAEIFREAGVETGLTDEAVINEVVKRYGCAREAVTLQERHLAQAFQEALFAWEKKPPALPQRHREHRGQPKLEEDSRRSQRNGEDTESATGADRGEELRGVLAKAFGVEPKSGMDDATGIQGEIRSRLMKAGKRAFAAEKFVNEEEARELVLELGGIPCYPTLADGAGKRCEFEETPTGLVERLRERGINLAEVIPVRNKPEVLREYVRALREAGIAVVAGTEHNTPEMRRMEPTCKGGVELSEEMKAIFREGACVVAAHQAMTAGGRCGFVDEQGRPNGEYGDAEERIKAFAEIGAGIIEKVIG